MIPDLPGLCSIGYITCIAISITNKKKSAMLLTSMSEHEKSKKVNKELEDSRNNHDNNQPILQNMITPYVLNDIQPRATQVWNCNEVGFYPNIIWIKVICTYKFFQGEQTQKVKIGKRALFWCTLIVFTQADRRCFMPPIIVHQSKY